MNPVQVNVFASARKWCNIIFLIKERNIMRLVALSSSLLLSACAAWHGNNPIDPYEPVNREIYKFNVAFDATFLKPPARLYKAVIPGPVRMGVNNFYENINMIPTTANDLLQGDLRQAYRDSWRFFINSTIGIGGVFDPAESFGLPRHTNDLGLTFARWGDKKSPYIMVPFIGPSTIRDGMGMLFEYTIITPYPYITNQGVLYGLLGLRYVDLRAQLFDTERLMQDALDPYSFMRDAYLQHRSFLINGPCDTTAEGSAYVEDNSPANDYIEE